MMSNHCNLSCILRKKFSSGRSLLEWSNLGHLRYRAVNNETMIMNTSTLSCVGTGAPYRLPYHSELYVELFLYVRYSFLLISNKFCDLSLMHWPLLRAVWRWGGGGEGGAQCGKKNLLHWASKALRRAV
jgi:hypothetical protein